MANREVEVASAMRSIPAVREWLRQGRTAFWKWRYGLRHVDPTFLLSHRCLIHPDFEAGPFGFMNIGCRIGPRVKVGKYVMFGPDVSIVGADHRFDEAGTPMIFGGRPEQPATNIGDDVWLGARCIVLAGVSIGRGSIVAAGALVHRDVPEFSIVGGVPARVIRQRFTPEEQLVHERMLDEPARRGDYCDPKA